MNPLVIGTTYHLRLPDTRSLGQVRIQRLEDGWAEGPFGPAAAFSDFRSLFEEEAQLRNDQVIPLWEEAADRIERLGIQVIGEKGDTYAGWRIFIDGGEAFLAPPSLACPTPADKNEAEERA